MSDDLSDFDEVCWECESYPGDCEIHDQLPMAAGEIPLPPEPVYAGDEYDFEQGDAEDAEDAEAYADAQALAAAEDPEQFDPPSWSADEVAEMMGRHAAARRVHIARPKTFTRWSMGGFDPQARHVGCDGEPDGAGGMRGGCGRPPGEPCEHPRRGAIVGYVHPSRLAAERAVFGLD